MATPLPVVEAVERSLLDVLGNLGELREVGAAHAAHHDAGGIERRRRQRLALDERRGETDAVDLGDAVGDGGLVGERGFQRLDQQDGR